MIFRPHVGKHLPSSFRDAIPHARTPVDTWWDAVYFSDKKWKPEDFYKPVQLISYWAASDEVLRKIGN